VSRCSKLQLSSVHLLPVQIYHNCACQQVIIYPVGIPALYAARLYLTRDLLRPQQQTNDDQQATVPLVAAHTVDTEEAAAVDLNGSSSNAAEQQPAVATALVQAQLVPVDAHTLTAQETKFLWKAYKAPLYYWEVIECCRRLLLTGFMVCQYCYY
jgi:hypothetical protein